MDKQGGALVWAVAVLALLGVVCAALWGFNSHRDAMELSRRLIGSEDQAREAQAQVRQQEEAAEAMESKVALLENKAKADQPSPAVKPTPAAEPSPAAEPAPPEPDEAKPLNQESGAQPAPGDDAMARMHANTTVSLHYGEFLQALNLSAEDEQRVRQVLVDHFLKQRAEKKKLSVKEREALLRDELAKLLDARQMALYDEYVEGADERVLGKVLNMQLGTFGSVLDDDQRQMVAQVVVEEMSALKQEQGKLNKVYPDAGSAMAAAMERARERLAPVLDEAQMRQVDAFFEKAPQLFNRPMPNSDKK